MQRKRQNRRQVNNESDNNHVGRMRWYLGDSDSRCRAAVYREPDQEQGKEGQGLMADIISVLVVLVFVVIVFRKRLAPLFKGRKQEEKAETVEASAAPVPADQAEGCEYVQVFAVDTGNYLSMQDLSHAVETEFHDLLSRIYNDYVGSFVGLDVITVNGIMVFLIRWHT